MAARTERLTEESRMLALAVAHAFHAPDKIDDVFRAPTARRLTKRKWWGGGARG